jgi:hypothetical protein
MLEKLRAGTDTQVGWLTAAGAFQAVAVCLLGVTTALVAFGADSQVQQARQAIEAQPGMSRLLDALDEAGLLKDREYVSKITTFFRLSCQNDAQLDPTVAQAELKKYWQVDVTAAQIENLEPARIAFCAAQQP